MKAPLIGLLLLASSVMAGEPDFTTLREQLVEEVRQYAGYAGDEPFSDSTLDALNTVERHKYVPPAEVRYAYENRPLSIGYGQTISQPYIVALMTDLLEPEAGEVILEVGTGSGYQAAVLSGLVEHVYTIEIVEALAKQARSRLDRLGYDNVTTRLGDGYYGWKEHAPFDAIIVTAAASHVPPPLIEQLKPGGRMVIPVGGRFVTQLLLLLEKNEDGEVIARQIGAVRFVPLTGEH